MAPRCYRIVDVCDLLQISPRTFRRLKAAGELPFLEELKPRAGRPRYRADLVDRYLANQHGRTIRVRTSA